MMRKCYIICLMMAILGTAGLLNAQSLIISEYCEYNQSEDSPKTYNHYVELYNPSDQDVDMADYQLWRAKNGGGWNRDQGAAVKPLGLTGSLAPKGTYVICRPDTGDKPVGVTGQMTWDFMNISGDDAIGLAEKDNSGQFILIDVIGTPDKDPGKAWDVAGIAKATKNHTLIRKPSICEPTSDWAVSAGTDAGNSQWLVRDENDISDVANHRADCPQ